MAVVAAVAANATAGNLKPPEVPGLPLSGSPVFLASERLIGLRAVLPGQCPQGCQLILDGRFLMHRATLPVTNGRGSR